MAKPKKAKKKDKRFIIDKNGEITPIIGLYQWTQWKKNNPEKCHIKTTELGHFKVETIFTGIAAGHTHLSEEEERRDEQLERRRERAPQDRYVAEGNVMIYMGSIGEYKHYPNVFKTRVEVLDTSIFKVAGISEFIKKKLPKDQPTKRRALKKHDAIIEVLEKAEKMYREAKELESSRPRKIISNESAYDVSEIDPGQGLVYNVSRKIISPEISP